MCCNCYFPFFNCCTQTASSSSKGYTNYIATQPKREWPTLAPLQRTTRTRRPQSAAHLRRHSTAPRAAATAQQRTLRQHTALFPSAAADNTSGAQPRRVERHSRHPQARRHRQHPTACGGNSRRRRRCGRRCRSRLWRRTRATQPAAEATALRQAEQCDRCGVRRAPWRFAAGLTSADGSSDKCLRQRAR